MKAVTRLPRHATKSRSFRLSVSTAHRAPGPVHPAYPQYEGRRQDLLNRRPTEVGAGKSFIVEREIT
jgi:hypothetical protein